MGFTTHQNRPIRDLKSRTEIQMSNFPPELYHADKNRPYNKYYLLEFFVSEATALYTTDDGTDVQHVFFEHIGKYWFKTQAESFAELKRKMTSQMEHFDKIIQRELSTIKDK